MSSTRPGTSSGWQDWTPGGKDQVQAHAQAGAGQGLGQLLLDAGLVDHHRGAGDDPLPVGGEDAPRHARGPAIVIGVDDQLFAHIPLLQDGRLEDYPLQPSGLLVSLWALDHERQVYIEFGRQHGHQVEVECR